MLLVGTITCPSALCGYHHLSYTNLNLSFHSPNPCLLLLPRSLMLSLPPPSPSPYPYASIYIPLPHTDTDFFRFYRKACANNKVFSCDLNWDSVGTFFRVAGREFQRDGAMKLKERCPSVVPSRVPMLLVGTITCPRTVSGYHQVSQCC